MSSQAIKYAGKIDLRVRNNSHSIAFELIDQLAKGARLRILDVGCAGGFLGEALKARGHEVWGVEPDPQSAAQARERLDHITEGTIEDFLSLPVAQKVQFDAMVFGDVLEHTADPESVLRRCRQRLSAEGAVVASVPNVAHLGVRTMLLEGRWDYDERGILDRTHLRFFTKSSLAQLFQSSGYAVDAIFPVRLSLEDCGIQVDPDLAAVVKDRVRDDALGVFQYVALARPVDSDAETLRNERFAARAKVRVLCLPPLPEWSIGDIRLRNPMSAWTSWHGGSVRFGWVGDLNPADFEWANIVVLQREADPRVLQLIDHCHAHGKFVVFDLDDLLTDVPEFLISHEHSKRVRPYLEAALRAADLVSTTTPRLAAVLSRFNPSVFVAPNCPLPIATPARHYATPHGRVLLFVASSDTVRVDFLVPALQRLLADPALNLNLVGIGPPGKYMQEAGLPVAAIDNIAYEQFGNFLAAHDNAIGLIPLDESHFSSCKSPIKFLDYSQAGLVSVCSRMAPYTDYVEDGVTGLLIPNDVDAWCTAVAMLAKSPEIRQRLADAARGRAQKQFSLRVAGDLWKHALDQLLQRAVSDVRAWDEPVVQRSYGSRRMRWAQWFLRTAVRPSSYGRAIHLLTSEGPTGVAKRVFRSR